MLLALVVVTMSHLAKAQSDKIVNYSPVIEPALGYVFKTESGFGAVRARVDIRNVAIKNKMGFYFTLEQNSNTLFGKYVRDLAGVSYNINRSFSVHAGAGLWSNGIITEGVRWTGLRKEIGVTYRIPQYPVTVILGYSKWAGPTASFGYSIPVDMKRILPKSRTVVKDTMYVVDTTARIQQKLDQDIQALEESSKIYFDYKSDTINNTEKIKLDELVKYLKANPKYKLEIYGNTDQTGSAEYNQALSDRRANNTKNYLNSQGISANRMKILPMGKAKAIGTITETEIDKAKLRSVEFEIIRK